MLTRKYIYFDLISFYIYVSSLKALPRNRTWIQRLEVFDAILYTNKAFVVFCFLLFGTGGIRTHEAYAWHLKCHPFDHSGIQSFYNCRLCGSNTGPLDLQSNALPTELRRHCAFFLLKIAKDNEMINLSITWKINFLLFSIQYYIVIIF